MLMETPFSEPVTVTPHIGFVLESFTMVVNNSVYCASPNCPVEATMEDLHESSGPFEEKEEDVIEEETQSRESSPISDFLVSEGTVNEEDHSSSEDSSYASFNSICKNPEKTSHLEGRKLEKQGSFVPEAEMMKERFAKLLLGEDMSGCGNGVCTALAISNAVTNLCATLFGQIWRLEPLAPEKKSMWRREMEWLVCVSDHIVELIPSWQIFPDGTELEVMTSRPRSDLYVNLPGLRKLDNMLLEILDSFVNTEFWYVDQGVLAPDVDGSSSLRRPLPGQEEKWWLPVPRVPSDGLREDSRKQLQHRRDCTNQILKAAMAINSVILADMEVPDSYYDSLPKNGRESLGDQIHRSIVAEQFSAECLLDSLNLSSEHQALEVANRVEASIYVWRRRISSKPLSSTSRSNSRSSWVMVKELVVDMEKRELLAERAESLLLSLKQRYPGLPQTTLDMTKIQYNKDVGKSILESYSRVLECLAFNIVARIDDLLYVDDMTKQSDQFMPISKLVSVVAHKNAGIIQYPSPFLPTKRIIPVKGEQILEGKKAHRRGFGMKKVFTDFLSIDTRGKESSRKVQRSDSLASIRSEASTSVNGVELREAMCSGIHDSDWEE